VHVCYIDESGGTEAPNKPIPGVTPVQVLVGLILDADHIVPFTRDFLTFKRRHFPKRYTSGPALSHLLKEIKGADILQHTRSSDRSLQRHAARIRADLLTLLETHGAKIVGRVWVKEPTKGLDPVAAYCFAVQDISRHFSHFMTTRVS
jgi:hypothetical protein